MSKYNIIQFTSYFPPHKGWVETVAKERATRRVRKWFGKVINLTGSVGLESKISSCEEHQKIYFQNQCIWYKENSYEVVIYPAREIIYNFPIPKFWTKQFWTTLKYIKTQKMDFFQTHTRFFVSSFLGWILAKLWGEKRVHIEHGSGFVKWLIWWKFIISWIYDNIFGRIIFRNCNEIVVISKKNIDFVSQFTSKKSHLIYRWIEFDRKAKKEKLNTNKIVKLWFVWRLIKLKWVDILIKSIVEIKKTQKMDFLLEIIWDWDQKEELENLVRKNNLWDYIKFLWSKDHNFVINEFLPSVDILINPSLQEWLPTTVLEWLLTWCVVVATDVWWTNEISEKNDLILVEPNNIKSLSDWISKAIQDIENLSWKSYEIVKEKFCWDKNIEKYFDLYEKWQKNI